MNGEIKLAAVEAQVKSALKKGANKIICPYCGAVNERGNPFCCETFAHAVEAVMERLSENQRIDSIHQISDKIQ